MIAQRTNTELTAAGQLTDGRQGPPANACCGGSAPKGMNACCARDAEAKSAGAGGCGCGTTPAVPATKTACCG